MRCLRVAIHNLIICLIITTGFVSSRTAAAPGPGAQGPDGGAAPNGDQNSPAGNGPVRMVRFSLVNGDVRWRPDESAEWTQATINLPIREQSQIIVADGGRAELLFDDGSLLRMDSKSTASIQTLYSDAKGEFTEISLKDGTASLHLMNDQSTFQVDTPFFAAKAAGPGRIRLDAHDTVDIGVKDGTVRLEGQQGSISLNASAFVVVQNPSDPFNVSPIPADDEWEQWNVERDRALDDAAARTRQDLPPNMALASPQLNDYGDWHAVPNYGRVWVPRVAPGWRPYFAGRWVWADPYGWTWVSSEEWGWVPYHYGTWVNTEFGWAWVPGPACQCWSPAVVSFCETDGAVAWVPLAPSEVRYPPPFAVGVFGSEWMASFSIGLCGVYYPGDGGRCYVRPWTNVYVNTFRSVTVVHDSLNVTVVNRSVVGRSVAFVPRNARFGGASMASNATMRSGGSYSALSSARFAALHATPVGAPPAGARPVAGPPAVKPTLASLAPSRQFGSGGSSSLNRQVYRAPLPAAVARQQDRLSAGRSAAPGSAASSATQRASQYGGTGSRNNAASYSGSSSRYGAASSSNSNNRSGAATYGSSANRAGASTYGNSANRAGASTYGNSANRAGAGTYGNSANRAGAGTYGGSANRTGAGAYSGSSSHYGSGTYSGSSTNRPGSGAYGGATTNRSGTGAYGNGTAGPADQNGAGTTGGRKYSGTYTPPSSTPGRGTYTSPSSTPGRGTYTPPNSRPAASSGSNGAYGGTGSSRQVGGTGSGGSYGGGAPTRRTAGAGTNMPPAGGAQSGSGTTRRAASGAPAGGGSARPGGATNTGRPAPAPTKPATTDNTRKN